MRHRRFILLTGILVAALACTSSASAAVYHGQSTGAQHFGGHSRHYEYYLALGDSLAAGWQPNPVTGVGHITDQGYASRIASRLRRHDRHLRYTNLACPGETTTSMLRGGCPYPERYKSQIAAATAFLTAHRHARILVTLDIGANNVDNCLTTSGINVTCLTNGFAALNADLPKILARLQAAGGRRTSIVAMTYYDPFLAEWLTGKAGQQLAKESEVLGAQFNAMMVTIYRKFHVPVADVSGRFDTSKFTPLVPLPHVGKVPLNVARICEWTWMCAPPPVGPNIHANATGYHQIARAFEEIIFARR